MQVRFFAAARAATGTPEVTVPIGAPRSLAAILAHLRESYPAAPPGEASLAEVLPRCSFLRNGVVVHDHADEIGPGDTLDILPPFSGG